MGDYRQDDVFRTLSQTDLQELVEEYTSLTPNSFGLRGVCPLPKHTRDRSSTFYVYPRTTPVQPDRFSCLECNVSGTAILFIQHMMGISSNSAIAYLARRVGNPLHLQNQSPLKNILESEFRSLGMMDAAEWYYNLMLVFSPFGRPSYKHLEQLQLTGEDTGRFGLGYVPDDNGFLNYQPHCMNGTVGENFSHSDLFDLGLLDKARRSAHTPVEYTCPLPRGSILIPQRDIKGDTIGFIGYLPGEHPQFCTTRATQINPRPGSLLHIDWAVDAPINYNNGTVVLTTDYLMATIAQAKGIRCVVGVGMQTFSIEDALLLAKHFRHAVISASKDEICTKLAKQLWSAGLEVSIAELETPTTAREEILKVKQAEMYKFRPGYTMEEAIERMVKPYTGLLSIDARAEPIFLWHLRKALIKQPDIADPRARLQMLREMMPLADLCRDILDAKACLAEAAVLCALPYELVIDIFDQTPHRDFVKIRQTPMQLELEALTLLYRTPYLRGQFKEVVAPEQFESATHQAVYCYLTKDENQSLFTPQQPPSMFDQQELSPDDILKWCADNRIFIDASHLIDALNTIYSTSTEHVDPQHVLSELKERGFENKAIELEDRIMDELSCGNTTAITAFFKHLNKHAAQ